MRTRISLLLSTLAVVCTSPSAWTAELTVGAGGPTRMAVPACPTGAVVAGFDAASGSLLCETGFFVVNGPSWIAGEVVDPPPPPSPPPPAPASAGVWPPDANTGIFHRYAGTPMHWCGPGRFMTGFNAATNNFLCAYFGGIDTQRRLFVTRPVRRSGLPACPRGSALTGIHLANGSFLCADFAHCAENAHCRVSAACETRSTPPRDEDDVLFGPGICRPSGTLTFNKRNGCNGDSAGSLTDRSGNVVDFTDSDSFDNDDAQSVRLGRVNSGTTIRIFDRSDGRRNDDFSEILVRSTTPSSYCVPTFEFANGMFSDNFITARYNDFGNLDEKVSRVEIETAIIGSGGKCLDINQNNSFVQLFPCHMGPNQSWTQLPNGTIRGLRGSCLEARPEDARAWGITGPRSARLQVGPCTGADNQLWARTTSQELRMFSDMCMDVAGGGNADNTPIQIYPCHGGANQRWLAGF